MVDFSHLSSMLFRCGADHRIQKGGLWSVLLCVVVRIVCGLSHSASYRGSFRSHGILTLPSLYMFRVILSTFREI